MTLLAQLRAQSALLREHTMYVVVHPDDITGTLCMAVQRLPLAHLVVTPLGMRGRLMVVRPWMLAGYDL